MMLTPFSVTFLAASFNALACLFLCFHEILLGPDRPNYPNGPWYQRVVLFALAVALAALTMERFHDLYSGAYVSPIVMVASGLYMAAQAVLLEQQLRRWLPAHLHARIRHLLAIASCKKRAAVRAARAQSNTGLYPGVRPSPLAADIVGASLGTLTLEGMRAIGPGEGAEVLADLPPSTRTPRESLGLPPLSA